MNEKLQTEPEDISPLTALSTLQTPILLIHKPCEVRAAILPFHRQETEAQGSTITSLRSHSQEEAGLGFEPRSPGARALSLSHSPREDFSPRPSLPCAWSTVSPLPPLPRATGLSRPDCCDMVCDRKIVARSGPSLETSCLAQLLGLREPLGMLSPPRGVGSPGWAGRSLWQPAASPQE